MSMSKRAEPRELTPPVDWAGIATSRVNYDSAATIFGQGDPAPSIMFVETGTVRLSVLSHTGKEAVVAVLEPGHFFGEGCLAGQSLRMASATAMESCTVLTVENPEMVRQLRAKPEFAERFLTHMLTRNIRIKKPSSINSSTRRRSAWRARCCCWLDTVNPRHRTELSPRCRRNCWQKWWGPLDRASTSS
jgi:CRP-like cAMP-binding protein